MGLFSRKTDKEIIAEGRSLYIKGDLSGANLKLIKLAMKGNDEACYWVGRICLEEAGKRGNAKRREQGKIYLEKGARLGNKDAALLLKKEFGMPNSYDNKEDEKVKAEAEAKAKAEAEAKAKAEEEARAKAETEAKAKVEKPAPDSTDKVLEEIHDLEKQIEAAFAEKQAELEKMEQLAAEEQAMKTIDEALQFMEEGKWDEAIQMLLAPAEKGYVLAVYYMAVALASKGEYEQALTWAKIVVNSEIEEEGKKEVNELIKKIEESIEEQQKAEQEKIERQNEIERLKNVTKEGVEAFKAGKAEKALQCWKEAAELGFIPSMFYLAQACSRKGELNEALAWLEKLMKCNLDEARAKKCKEIFDYCVQQKEIYNKALHLYREGKYQEAIENFKISASRGFLKSQIMLADMYSDDQRGQVDEKESYKWYRMAAEQGDVRSQRKVGIHIFNGDGVEENKEEGIKWLTLAAEQGDVSSQMILADLYYKGNGVEEDESVAYKWYTVAAENGNVEAQEKLFSRYSWGENENKTEALKWLRALAENGDLSRQHQLGDWYYKGIGTASDKKEAFKWFEKAANNGYKYAQTSLAKMYEKGETVSRNKEEAYSLYKKAAEQEEGYAIYKVAEMYFTGDGVTKDKQKAVELYTKAAEKYYCGEACYRLGELFEVGDSLDKDKHKASDWYKSAFNFCISGDEINNKAKCKLEVLAKQGDASAQYHLSVILELGLGGIERDEERSMQLFQKALEQKENRAEKAMAESYFRGIGGYERDFEQASLWCKRSIEHGNDSAKLLLEQIEKNQEALKRSQELYDEALNEEANKNYVEAMNNYFEIQKMYLDWDLGPSRGMVAVKAFVRAAIIMANIYRDERIQSTNDEIKNNVEEQMIFWIQEAETSTGVQGVAQYCEYIYMANEISLERQVELITQSAERGFVLAEEMLADLYYLGRGVEKNVEEAFKWYRKAAEQGDVRAQHKVAVMYDIGDGTEENVEEAFKWYMKVAALGDMRAQFRVSLMYSLGSGVKEDQTEAFKWCKEAAEQGDADAQWNLVVKYESGIGCEKNAEEAFKWCKKAAEQGKSLAQSTLSKMYEEGKGCKKNKEEAAKWEKAFQQHDDPYEIERLMRPLEMMENKK